ncbi:MAG: hypothetical protein ABI402_13965 [Ferruginibacter sp.]
MKIAIILYLIILSSFFILSCSKTKDDNNCISYSNSPVINIQGPNSGLVNQDFVITLTYGISNGCGEFDHLEKSVSGNTTTINVIGKYTGCICTQVYKEEQTVYTFKATTAGTYYLKFFKENNIPVMDTILVQ